MKEFIKNWGIFFLLVAIFIALRVFVIAPVSVNGHSMDPTLADGQKLMTYQLSTIDRFDIVTTKEPDDLDKLAVKRVIGLPNDHVQMEDDVLTVNGEEVDESYLAPYKQEFAEDKMQNEYTYNPAFQEIAGNADNFTNDFTYEVPEGEYFVLGDNRLISKDSRTFGFVDGSMIEGEVAFRYWPLSEISIINN
ncbi:signal peptidase I [Tetragenococcus osmophilus]|uniref:Signal peptidase I n=1 Tax=Tetragenococcus osmophilus TaxID=526944 RepID=A0AA37XN87_9ENTE|nr:signal peptidase I [Tetragenococcus osmophilus]AYW47563.1 signal peptidase I [Tetragenococcus osmophilus]GMA53181.1 signal peptidase I [Alicyclobacillus contaminans]GMA72844.1 signal peptidase I [Tetragenococcus osmophilus]